MSLCFSFYRSLHSEDFLLGRSAIRTLARRLRTWPHHHKANKSSNPGECGCGQRTFTKSALRKDHRGVDLISYALPFGRLWYAEPSAVSNAIGYAKFRSRSHDAVIRVYDDAGNVIDTHEHIGDFKEP